MVSLAGKLRNVMVRKQSSLVLACFWLISVSLCGSAQEQELEIPFFGVFIVTDGIPIATTEMCRRSHKPMALVPLCEGIGSLDPRSKRAIALIECYGLLRFCLGFKFSILCFPLFPKRKYYLCLFGVLQLCICDTWCWVTKLLKDSRASFSCSWCEECVATPSFQCVFIQQQPFLWRTKWSR